MFSTTPVNETAIDYHIMLAQDVIQNCLNQTELQTEMYCQLIKQTSKYRGQPVPEGSAVSQKYFYLLIEFTRVVCYSNPQPCLSRASALPPELPVHIGKVVTW